MAEVQAFQPDWVSAPGETISELLRIKHLSIDEFARQLGTPLPAARGLIAGASRIDGDLAVSLERVLGPSSSFWLNREGDYRRDLERLSMAGAEVASKAWTRQFPIRDMIRFGWIRDTERGVGSVAECLRFFGVADVPAWQARYGGDLAVAAFRMSPSSKANPAAISAWLRWAELVGSAAPCGNWDAAAFRARLDGIRRLTWRKNPGSFLPILRQACAECGVALVIAPTPAGCPASGATRFLPGGRALMVLSFRYRSDDQFWFTFFHEAGHLLLHGDRALFLEDGSEATSQEEFEANAFARDVLIPARFAGRFVGLEPKTAAIIAFAKEIGIAPGLVVGQLQFHRRVGHDRLNGLKRRYDWDNIPADRVSP